MSPLADDERGRFRRAVGTRVRMLRARHGWSQEELAKRAGLHRTFVGAIERGSHGMNYDRLPDLAAALAVEPYALIPGREAFTGAEPAESWTLPGMVLFDELRHEEAQRRLAELLDDDERRLGPIDPEVMARVDAQWRAAASL